MNKKGRESFSEFIITLIKAGLIIFVGYLVLKALLGI